MKFLKDEALSEWLFSVQFSKGSFQWDQGNAEKNLKHGVTQEEVEEIFQSPFVLGGKIIEPFHPENRWILLGQTLKGKRFSLIFTIRDDLIRPISCRPMRNEEEKIYEKTLKG